MDKPKNNYEKSDINGGVEDRIFPPGFFEIFGQTYNDHQRSQQEREIRAKQNKTLPPQNKSYYESWWGDISRDKRIELILTLAIVFSASLQVWITVRSNAGTTQQTDQIIQAAHVSAYAAQQNVIAAQSFAVSAEHINRGVAEAVTKLQVQADRMEESRVTSQAQAQQSLDATIENFHQDQRAWLIVDPAVGVPKMEPYSINIPIRNTGRTPAKKVLMYFVAHAFPDNAPKKYVFIGVPQPMGIIAPAGRGENSFFYNGKGFPYTREFLATYGTYTVYGAITYEDVFSNKHWLTYCFYLQDSRDDYAYCPYRNDMGDGPIPENTFDK